MPTKTVLITGGAGYIGSHTGLLLMQQGYHVIILDRISKPINNIPGALYICGDIANRSLLNDIFNLYRIDAVMHFAASIDVRTSLMDPRAYYENNVTKTLILLDIMLDHNVRTCIFSSSCAVYGNPLYTPLDEHHPLQPITPYGMSKLMIERILHDYAQAYDFNYICLRYFNAAGAQPEYNLGEHHAPETHLIPLVLTAMQTNKAVHIFGTTHDTPDGTCIRDFLHVRDIAAAHSLALNYLDTTQTSGCFNIGTGQGISVQEIVQAAEKLFNTKITKRYTHARAGDPAILTANATKAHTLLGWQPQHSDINTILHSTYATMQTELNHNDSTSAECSL
jgi:UDP-glucose 4-epimerase